MQPNRVRDSDDDSVQPFASESSVVILSVQDRRPIGMEIQCLSRPSLFLLRARISGEESVKVGDEIPTNSDKLGTPSEVRLKDLKGSAFQELLPSLASSISYNPDRHLSFYNSAGPMSLKFHAFQLLPGIGNSKALQMVRLRGSSGWESFEKIDEDCGIESIKLLAERYVKEMEDVAQTPRLIDLLVRSETN